MDETTTVQLTVKPETARALADPRRRAAVERLVDGVVRPTAELNPLAVLLESTARHAQMAGLTDEEIEAELKRWKAERAASREREDAAE